MAKPDSFDLLRTKKQRRVRHKVTMAARVIGLIAILAGIAGSIYLATTCFRQDEWLALLSTPNPKLIVSPRLLALSTTEKPGEPCSCLKPDRFGYNCNLTAND
jgi:hypothetical protein